MDPRLAGCWKKIERAEKHLRDLHTEVRHYLGHDPDAVVAKRDPKTGEAVVHVKPGFPAPPIVLSVIVGDIAHNLRSCLNHLVVQLVFLNRKNPTDHIDFPVFPHKPMTAERIAVWEGKVQGMSKIAVAGIERLQPYNWRKDFPVGYHPLEILVGLNDWDKHKTLTFVGPKPVQRSAVITYPSGVQVTMKAFKNVPFKSHAELMRIPSPSRDQDVNVDVETAAEVFFHNREPGKGQSVLPSMYNLVETVGTILLNFEGMFHTKPPSRSRRVRRLPRS